MPRSAEPLTRSVSLDLIDEPDAPARSDITADDIDDLARSLAAIGQLQPIVLRPNGSRFKIIIGHRRYLAARSLGWATIEAKIRDLAGAAYTGARLTENVQREPMNPYDEATELDALMTQGALTAAEVTRRLGKSRGWVDTRLALLALPRDLAAPVQRNEIGIGLALALAEILEPGWRTYYLHHAINEGASVEQCRAWARTANEHVARQAAEGLPTEAPSLMQPPPEPLYPCWACQAPVPIRRLRQMPICNTCLSHIADLQNEEH